MITSGLVTFEGYRSLELLFNFKNVSVFITVVSPIVPWI